jgi:hypothetical protein
MTTNLPESGSLSCSAPLEEERNEQRSEKLTIGILTPEFLCPIDNTEGKFERFG